MRCIWSPALIRGNTVWQYYRDEPFLDNNGNITDFPDDNINSTSFKFKTKMAGRIGEEGKKNVKIRLPLNYLGNFWRILEILFINCEINLVLTWPVRCSKTNIYNNWYKNLCSICDFINFKRLQLVKEIITQTVASYIIPRFKNATTSTWC